MKVIVSDTPQRAAESLTAEILDALGKKPDLVLGLATGSTPLGVYANLIRAHEDDGVDFSRVRTFNLDEYMGLPATHEQSYRRFMQEHLFDQLNVPPENIRFPPTDGNDLTTQCERYEETIREAGGIDIQILGIGSNGHIGFNEPTSSLASRTRVKTLTDKTLTDNSRFYADGETQPQLAVTMGIGTILDAKRILLQAFGSKKAEAIRAAIEGPITSLCPGSALQLHPKTTFYLDPESGSLLTLLDYYRRTQENETDLQRQGRL